MLPVAHRIAFVALAVVMVSLAARGFMRIASLIRAGSPDTDLRTDHMVARVFHALADTLLQTRVFRKRPWVSFFHSFIFYGFVFYMLVNLVDAVEGFVPFSISSETVAGAAYNLVADLLSAMVLLAAALLIARRFALPSRRDFRFNERTLLHEQVGQGKITRDSLIVSAFILFHVGSRAIGAAAKVLEHAPDEFQPFATALSRLVPPAHAEAFRLFGYWGALGSVLLFLPYFVYSKHIHIAMAPLKYAFARSVPSGVLPLLELDLEAEEPKLGAEVMNDLAWPRLLDAYACIQCNRCQDVCPATATGKSPRWRR